MVKQLLVLGIIFFFLGRLTYAQLSISAAGESYTIDFDNNMPGVNNGQFDGSGFTPGPSAGQLDSDAWEVVGLSDGDLTFGGSESSGDFARGHSYGDEVIGGLYAFEVETGNVSLGVQPTSSDWTPGTIVLRLKNNTGFLITDLTISYRIWYLNNENRANALNFSHSGDNMNYTLESSLDFVSAESSVSPVYWQSVDRNIILHNLSIMDEGYYYLKWSGEDISGSGSRDEFGIDDITISAEKPKLFISEIADPLNPTSSDIEKFLELYNKGSYDIDFAASTWYISRQVNGSTNVWRDVRLTGIIQPGETYVIAYSSAAFFSAYGFNADQYNGNISGDGNDVYTLCKDGGYLSGGILVDIYGEADINGFGTGWDYENSKAVRRRAVSTPCNTWNPSEWVIIPADVDPSTNTNECTPGWHDRELTWNGASSDWADADNWSNSGSPPQKYPPDAGCDVVIPNVSNSPVISVRASTNNLEIEAGAVVTVTPTNFLVTGSEIDNQAGTAGLVVKSDASGDGMLLLGSGATQATIERYLTDDRSHFISAPTTNATADDLFQDHAPEVYLYEYHEWDGSYYYLVPTSTPMPSGKGFSTWVDDASMDYIIAEFDGVLMSSDLDLSTSTIPSLSYTSELHGWNLIGNPFPVPLNWKKGSWILNNVEQTVWIWQPDDNNTENPDGHWLYKPAYGNTGNFNGVIPPEQAFFIRTTGSNPSITIPANARTVYYPSTNYYKSREEETDSSNYAADYIEMKAMNSQDVEEIWISFNMYGTELFDNGWDASKLRNAYSTICLYIPKETRDQCIEHLSSLITGEERLVEVGFETTVDGEHSIVIDASYMPDTDIALEDLKYNVTQDMNDDSIYTFTAFTEDDPNRFRIHFNKTTTGIEFDGFGHQQDQSIQIYAYGKHVYIRKDDINASAYVMIFDMYGREILHQQTENTNLMKIPIHLSNTYLIVKVISNHKVYTSKVYIH